MVGISFRNTAAKSRLKTGEERIMLTALVRERALSPLYQQRLEPTSTTTPYRTISHQYVRAAGRTRREKSPKRTLSVRKTTALTAQRNMRMKLAGRCRRARLANRLPNG